MKKQWFRSPRRHLPGLALVCFGIFVSALCFVTLRSLETEKTQAVFHRVAQERIDNLQSDLELTVDKVADLGAFCDSSYPIARTSFEGFASAILSPDAGIQALEWVPRVSLAQRAALERSARASGLAGFEIRDRLEQGKMVRSRRSPRILSGALCAALCGQRTGARIRRPRRQPRPPPASPARRLQRGAHRIRAPHPCAGNLRSARHPHRAPRLPARLRLKRPQAIAGLCLGRAAAG